MATSARLSKIWRWNTITFASTFKLYKSSCHLHPPLRLWNMDPACWLRKKDPGLRNQIPEENSLHLLLGAQDQRLGAEQDQIPCGSTGTSSGTVEKRKLAWFGNVTHHDSLSFGASWRVVGAVVGRGSAGWTTSKSGRPCPCQNRSQGPPAEKAGREYLLNRFSCPPLLPRRHNRSSAWTELNRKDCFKQMVWASLSVSWAILPWKQSKQRQRKKTKQNKTKNPHTHTQLGAIPRTNILSLWCFTANSVNRDQTWQRPRSRTRCAKNLSREYDRADSEMRSSRFLYIFILY